MNWIQVIGFLGADPVVRFTADGKKVTSFNIATNQRRGDQEETIWWRVTVWGDRFDNMMAYFKKGSAVVVMGELRKPEIYQAQDGPRVTLEIWAEALRFAPSSGKRDGAEGGQGAGQQQPTATQQQPTATTQQKPATTQQRPAAAPAYQRAAAPSQQQQAAPAAFSPSGHEGAAGEGDDNPLPF